MTSFSLPDFFRNAVFSYSYRFIALIAGMAYFFVVANNLGPEKYGVLAFLLDFLGTATLLIGFNALYEILTVFIPKHRNEETAKKLISIGIFAAFVISAFIYLFPEFVLSIANSGDVELVRIISCVVLLSTTSALFINVFTGTKNFGKIFKMGVFENILNFGFVCVFLFYFNGGLVEVVYAKIISLAGSTLLGIYFFKEINFEKEKTNWVSIKKYAGFAFLSGIAKKTSSQIILILVGFFVDPLRMGFYYALLKMGTYLIDMPLNALNLVLLPTVSETDSNPEKLQKMISYGIKFYVLSSIIFSAGLVIAGPIVLQFFFPAYIPAIPLIPLFATYFVLTFDIPVGTFYRAINRNEVLFKSNIFQIFTTIIFGYFLVSSFGVEGVILTMVINRLLILIYQYFDIKKQGYKIEFWPRFADIIFFKNSFVSVISKKKS